MLLPRALKAAALEIASGAPAQATFQRIPHPIQFDQIGILQHSVDQRQRHQIARLITITLLAIATTFTNHCHYNNICVKSGFSAIFLTLEPELPE
jgi:hypothetical protein